MKEALKLFAFFFIKIKLETLYPNNKRYREGIQIWWYVFIFCDREKGLKFEAEGREFANI